MKKIDIIALWVFATVSAQAQQISQFVDKSWKEVYRPSAPIINNLVHTTLEAKFDYNRSCMYGKVWLTLHPHFYSTDSLTLDAKGMDIKQVALFKDGSLKNLKFNYVDSLTLHIQLDKIYTKDEKYIIYIDYISKPNELRQKGSAAIQDAKGLYFINPKGEEDKPTQIWTQGETESNSTWCPTIDKPNQKTTQEIYMTVPDKYVTLSNGLLISQQKNNDGTRTDYWKMDLPHAPYLMFMGAGEYAIIKDSYNNKEVNYYVEKPYESMARQIFGKTPEMIRCFSVLTGVKFPWPKYDQMVARDYVSGAMENTTATLHQEQAQQNARQLIDQNRWEDVISHELFHQWFGDLVTCESWSNITLNESFATYGEILWREYKYGKESAQEHFYHDLQAYLESNSEHKNLVRFYYADKEDLFDNVSYPKGGCILHMLRYVVGDSAFFKSLNLYLNTNKFKSAEAHQLRLAFEEVTGQDLNWFFNQWYYGNGHPKLDIHYTYDSIEGRINVHVKQMQESKKIFYLPFAIDVYDQNQIKRYNVVLNKLEQVFSLPASQQYDLVNVDADKYLVCAKEDHKSLYHYMYQYKNGKNYIDKIEALEYFDEHLNDPLVRNVLIQALQDKNYLLRIKALKIFQKEEKITLQEENLIYTIAKKDPYRLVRASAIDVLSNMDKKTYKSFFSNATKDSSYTVAGYSLKALMFIDKTAAFRLAKTLKIDAKDQLEETIEIVKIVNKTDNDFEATIKAYQQLELEDKIEQTRAFIYYLSVVKNTEKLKKGLSTIFEFRDMTKHKSPHVQALINEELKLLIKLKKRLQKGANNDAQIEYIKTQLVV